MATVRTSFLDKILGKDKAQQVNNELSAIAQALDGMGVSRKQFDTLVEKGVMEDLHADFMAALGKVTDTPDESVASEMIALAMGKLLQGDVVEAVADDEEMAGDIEEDMVDEEFRSLSTTKQLSAIHELVQQNKEYMESAKAYTDESTQIVKDMSELAEALLPALTVVSQLQPVIKNLDGLNADDFDNRLKSLESAIKSRPRQASQEVSTIATEAETKSMQTKNLDDVPEAFKGAFKQES